MTPTSENAPRSDPYRNFKFRLRWNGRCVAGFSQVSALQLATPIVKHREGGDPGLTRTPFARVESEAITLERGVTLDPDFLMFANRVWNPGAAQPGDDFRTDLILELFDETGKGVLAWKIFRAWVSEFQALPELDANANAVAIACLKLENEGWELLQQSGDTP